MNNTEKVLYFLQSIAPRPASNGEISSHTGVKPHQQVFQITEKLVRAGKISSLRDGKSWYFYAGDSVEPIRKAGNAPHNPKPVNDKKRTHYQEKVLDMAANFGSYHAHFYKLPVFTGPSLYFHRKALTAANSADTERYLEYIYSALVSWGMHRMGAKGSKMADFDQFQTSVLSVWDEIASLKDIPLHDVSDKNWETLEIIFKAIKVMHSNTSIVGNSKVMAHLLPAIVPPIDRAYTLKFLKENLAENHKQREWNLMKRIIQDFFLPITENEDFSIFAASTMQHQDQYPWDTSLPKIVDNLIIGALKQKLGNAQTLELVSSL